jgi:hypothetical protein
MAVMPGDFEFSRGEEGKEKKKERNSRVTGIWVSQRDTCWNGKGERMGQGQAGAGRAYGEECPWVGWD